METKPALTLYVTTDCAACRRAEEVLRNCEEIASFARLEVVLLGGPDADPPAKVIGAPTLVYKGEVVGLGTPDCCELAARLKASCPIHVVS